MSNMINPQIKVENNRGVYTVPIQTEALMERKIFVLGEINQDTVNEFVLQFMYLSSQSDELITVYINSPGGAVTDGLVIYDLIKSAVCPVRTVCLGTAASMGALILTAGNKGERYILPHSKVMIHEPLIANGIGGSATSIHNIAESIMQTKEITNGILSDCTGKSREEIDEATAYDHYMNAREAIEFGICDKITRELI